MKLNKLKDFQQTHIWFYIIKNIKKIKFIFKINLLKKEMEKIIASKKNLMERWQRSLANMQRRDKAV